MTKVITVAAGIVLNDLQQMLVVRKKGTEMFMHVGGKLEQGESPEQALRRELIEEVACDLKVHRYIGEFQTAAANEPDTLLVSHLFHIELCDVPQLQAELEEIRWLDLFEINVPIAPLLEQVSIPWCKAYLQSR